MLIFNKIALIFLGIPIVFIFFSVSGFIKSNRRNFIANSEWPQFIWPQSTGLSGFAEMLESYYKLPKLKQFPSLQVHFSWFCLPCRRKQLTTLWKTSAF